MEYRVSPEFADDCAEAEARTDDCDDESEWAEPFTFNSDSLLGPALNDVGIDCKATEFLSKMGHARTIIHFDIDCFYAQVEMLRNPELRHKPLGIQQKNIIVTSNYEARKLGVGKLTYVTDAKKKCPQLVLVSGEDLTNYRQMSYTISEFIQKYTPHVERLGFDENFVDVSELVSWRMNDGNYKAEFIGHVYGADNDMQTKPHCSCGCELRIKIGSQIAADIREALDKELGITCCAGISHNKLLAKLVAATHKPNQQTSLLPHRALELMLSLQSARSIPGIGSKCSKRLQALGISSVRDLQTSDPKMLEGEFGSDMSQLLTQLSFGVDDSPVIKFSLPQSISDEDSFKCCNNYSDAESRIKDLLTSLLKRLLEDGRIPQTLRLTVRKVNNNYHRESRQYPLQGNIFTKFHLSGSSETVHERLMTILMNLFCKMVNPAQPFHLTLINICFAKFTKPGDREGKIESFFSRAHSSSKESDSGKDLNKSISSSESHCIDLASSSMVTSSPQKKYSTAHQPASGKKTIAQFFLQKNRSDQHVKVTDKAACAVNVPQDLVSRHIDNHKVNDTNNNKSHKRHCNDCETKSESEEWFSHGPKPSSSPDSSDANSQTFICDKATNQSATSAAILDKSTHPTQSEGSSNAFPSQTLPEQTLHINENPSLPAAKSMEEKSLQNLLPSDIDAKTIAELPADIQKEVLLQYGIFVEEQVDGKVFTLLSDRVTTRSAGTTPTVTNENKRHLSSKKRNAMKRKLPLSLQDPSNGVETLEAKKTAQEVQMQTAETPMHQQLEETNKKDTGIHSIMPNMNQTDGNFVSENFSTSHSCSGNEEVICIEDLSGHALLKENPAEFHCLPHEGEQTKKARTAPSSSNTTPEKPSSDIDITLKSKSPLFAPDQCHKVYIQHMNSSEKSSYDITDHSINSLSNSAQKSPTPKQKSTVKVTDPTEQEIVKPSSAVGNIHNLLSPASKTNTRNQLFKGKLPKDIDSEVFSALPSNIQGEIMAHVVMGASGSSSKSKSFSSSEKTQRAAEVNKKKGQNTLLSYFKKNIN